MARTPRTQRPQDEDQELNLAPIMNMVVILIPLLLLSVVFVSVSVINVNAPSLAPGQVTETIEEPEQKITVTISVDGFHVATRDGVLPPITGCPEGPTVCMRGEDSDVAALFAEARSELERGQRVRGEALLDRGMTAYDWPGLYNTLSQLKRDNPDEDRIHISADADIPYAAVVRLFDVSRVRLEKDHYADAQAFWDASPRRGDERALFPDPILAVVQ